MIIPPDSELGSGGGGGGLGTGVGPSRNILRIRDNQDYLNNYAYDVHWSYIDLNLRTGLMQPGAKVGDVMVTMGSTAHNYDLGADEVYQGSGLVLCKQISPTTYEEIVVEGLGFTNYVYQGKTVEISAWDAFYKKDEYGFILPLHQQLLQSMSLIDETQLAHQVNHLVFNSYQIVKKKWYQSGWFQVILVIIAIVLIVISWGGATPVVGGMFGAMISAIAVGLSVSLLVASIIVATLAVLASMILMKLLTPVAVKAFGPTWGPIIAAVISMIAFNWAAGANLATSVNITTMSTPQLIGASLSVLSKAVDIYAQQKMAGLDVSGKIEALKTEAEARTAEIKKLSDELLGTNTDLIDIHGLVESTNIHIEAASTFLARTLMTGSDIAEITRGLISDFAGMNLTLPTSA